MKYIYLLLFVMLIKLPAHAQLTGTVTDKETGELLNNIPVTITNRLNNEKLTV